MKAVCAVVVVLALSLHLEAKPFTTLADPIWTNCTKASDEAKIIFVNFDPMKPKKGDTENVQAFFVLKEEVTGGQISVKAALDGITLLNSKYDLCDTLGQIGLKCPVSAGNHTIKVSEKIPKIAPRGTYTAHATITDQNGAEVACADAKYKLE